MSLFSTYVVEGHFPGPHVLIIAGVHGDEWEPMAAVRALYSELDPAQIRGKVTLVPVVHEAAFWNVIRCGLDGKDLARSCPGNETGTPTEILAHEVSSLIGTADYLVDLHTGGVAYYLMPLVGYGMHPDPKVHEAQRGMARAFGTPLIWGTPASKGRTLSVAGELGIPGIYAEWGGGAPMKTEAVYGYVHGCKRVLSHLNVLDGDEEFPDPLYWVEEADVEVDLCGTCLSPVAGFWESCVEVGEMVEKDQVLGHIWTLPEAGGTPFRAPHRGLLICVRGVPAVKVGESLARVVAMDEVQS